MLGFFNIFSNNDSLGTMPLKELSPSSDEVKFALADFLQGSSCKGMPQCFLMG